MSTASKTLDHSFGKTARLEARITEEQKSLFQKAAEMTGRSLTDFVVACVQETASRMLREQEVMTLSVRDREVFVSALLDAPALAPRLRKAVQRYKTHQHRTADAQ